MTVHAQGGMTAEKLRQIADYITESDNIIADLLDKHGVTFKRGEKDETNEWSELVSGRAMQEDLRLWADALLGKPPHVDGVDFIVYQRGYHVYCPACGNEMQCERCDSLERCEVCQITHDHRDGWSVDGDGVYLCPDHSGPEKDDLGDDPVTPAILRTSDGAAHLMMGDRCTLCGLSYNELRRQEDSRFDQQNADRLDFESGMP